MYLWGKVYVVRSDEKPTLEIKMPTGEGQGVGNLSPMNEVESRKTEVTGINIRKTLRNNWLQGEKQAQDEKRSG